MFPARSSRGKAAIVAFACIIASSGQVFAATTHIVSPRLAVIEVPTNVLGWQGTPLIICPNASWYLSVQGVTNVSWGVNPSIGWYRWASPGGEPTRIPIQSAPTLLVPRAPVSSLVARIGTDTLFVGGGGAIPPVVNPGGPLSGPLELGYNDSNTLGNINSILVIMYCFAPNESDCSCGAASAPSSEVGQLESPLLIDAGSANPVHSSAKFVFSVPRGGDYDAGIYDAMGRRVRDLFAGSLEQGSQSVDWDLKDGGGKRVASGIYFCRLTGGNDEVARKLVVVE